MLQSREYVSALPRLCGLNRINRAEDAMASIYKASYVSLHVRKSNRAALSLYRDSLGFTVQGIEKKYCVSTNLSDLVSLSRANFRCRWRRRICNASLAETVTAVWC
jgi:hypothetical protein